MDTLTSSCIWPCQNECSEFDAPRAEIDLGIRSVVNILRLINFRVFVAAPVSSPGNGQSG